MPAAFAEVGVERVYVRDGRVFFSCYHTTGAPGGWQVGGYLHAPDLQLVPSGALDDPGMRIHVEHLDGSWYAYWWNS